MNPQQRRRLGEVTRLPAAHRMLLAGLSREELAAKIQTLIGRAARANFVDEVFARGQGNPFFTAELVAAHLSGQAIPAVLSDLIASDLEGLDVDQPDGCRCSSPSSGATRTHDLLLRVAEVDADASRSRAARRDRRAARRRRPRHRCLPVSSCAHRRGRLRRAAAAGTQTAAPPRRRRAGRSGAGRPCSRRSSQRAGVPSRPGRRSRRRRSSPCCPPRTPPRPWPLRLPCAISSARSSFGTPPASRAPARTAVTGSGRPPSSQAAPSATSVPRSSLGKPSVTESPPRGAAWGHERLGRYLWGAGHIEESVGGVRGRPRPCCPTTRDQKPRRCSPAWGRPSSCSATTTPPKRERTACSSCSPAPEADPLAWAMARRVLGIVVDHGGDPGRGVELCREAVAAAPNAQTKRLAVLYLGVALLDAGEYQDAVNEMLDAAADGATDRARPKLRRLPRRARGGRPAPARPVAGSRREFSVRAKAPRRFRWDRSASPSPARCSRRVEASATEPLLRCSSRPRRCRSIPFIGGSSTEPRRRSSLALGDWADAAAIAERVLTRGARRRFGRHGSSCTAPSPRSSSRSMPALDANRSTPKARRRDFGGESTRLATRRKRAGAGRSVGRHRSAPGPRRRRRHTSRRLRSRGLGRSGAPLGRPRRSVLAGDGSVREAEAAVAVGATARAAEALQEAHQLASSLGAVAAVDGHRGRVTTDSAQRRSAGRGGAGRRRDRSSRPHASGGRGPRHSSRRARRTDRSVRPCSCPRRPRASTSRTSCASSGSAAESTPPRSRNASASPDSSRAQRDLRGRARCGARALSPTMRACRQTHTRPMSATTAIIDEAGSPTSR